MSFNNVTGNKIRVTRLLGGSHPLGCMDPKISMPVYTNDVSRPFGYIASLSFDNLLARVAINVGNGVSGTHQLDMYPFDLFTTEAWATGAGNSAWPTGDGSILFGHHGVFPNGVPKGNNNYGEFMNGNSVPSGYSRAPTTEIN